MFVARFDRRIFFTIRQKRISGGSTYVGREGRVGGGSNERARGSDDVREGGSESGGMEGRLIEEGNE